mgnify:CR=1 FL=1
MAETEQQRVRDAIVEKVLEQARLITGDGRAVSSVAEREYPRGPSTRLAESLPGIFSWLVLTSPVWLTMIDAQLGAYFLTGVTIYFAGRVSYFGLRSLLNRARVLNGSRRDWLADLNRLEGQEWQRYRVTLLIRAFREGNRQMLRETLESIYQSNWPKVNGVLRNVEVVFATERDDDITPPLVDELASEYAGRLAVRQIKHPPTPGHLPGPSSAMHYAGKVLYEEALREGFPPHHQLVADFDCDTLFHPQYLPALVYSYATDECRHRHAYQPVVLFTTAYWQAPLHSRIAALGTSILTLGWNRKPDIAFTGAAASLALLKSVDFWPTNSHSQDSGVELRFRLRHGSDFRVVGLPVPLWVYPVMVVGEQTTLWQRVVAYCRSFRTLFRQSARWREGPLDEFVETIVYRNLGLMLWKLRDGLERDTLTILPAAGPVLSYVILAWQGQAGAAQAAPVTPLLALVLTLVSILGLTAFLFVMGTEGFMRTRVPLWRRVMEITLFWLVFSVYVPIITAGAGLKTSSEYMLGRRPRGHYTPTPK